MNDWITTISMWNELVRQVLETADSYKVVDGTKESQETRITKNKDDLQKYKSVKDNIKSIW